MRTLALTVAASLLAVCGHFDLRSGAWAAPRKSPQTPRAEQRLQPRVAHKSLGDHTWEPSASSSTPSSGRWASSLLTPVVALALLVGACWAGAAPAVAGDKRMVGEIPASGLIFKDTINIEEFDDPKVKGVSLYISDFSRSFADRVGKGDFFSDPGAAGLTCVASGPVKVSPDLKSDKQGEDVFSEARSILFKTLKVKRIYDAEGKNLVYVVFTERVDTDNDKNKSRFKSQICAVHVDGTQ